MATFPTSVTPPGTGAPPQGAPGPGGSSGGSSPAIKLAMLGQVILGLAKEFPQGQEGIKMMMDGLRKVQASASAQTSAPQPAAPPR